ncbi:hypothetical protein GAYE_SCF02G2164 [Galdieria yellowstonensis]|uniref:Uncharacterized protein n=1 Tax=Galdieria yellowstonensis TaxID=3028027 RepID=A0AAV9IA16_9RHOD|nr:hypothetical protein GAYE_SCF02G2164 [Galdieria yellowstonensis]
MNTLKESLDLYIYLKNIGQRKLAEILSILPGPKILLFEQALYDQRLGLARMLDLWADNTFLKEHGVQSFESLPVFLKRWKQIPEDSWYEALQQMSVKQLVFIIRTGRVDAAKQIIDIINRLSLKRNGANTVGTARDESNGFRFLCALIPRKSSVFEYCFEQAASQVEFVELPLGFAAVERDLLTLDQPYSFRDMTIDGDYSSLLHLAQALIELEQVLGSFKHIRGIGQNSCLLSKYLSRYYNEKRTKTPRPRGRGASISNRLQEQSSDSHLLMILFDRSVDLTTPFVTQSSFAGLLDETFHLTNTSFIYEVSSIGSSKDSSIDESKKETSRDAHSSCIAHITPKDSVFDQLKDRNFSVATERLGMMASSMREFYRSKPSPERSEMSQVKDFVRNLTNIKAEQEAVSFHTELACEISKRTFESYLFKQKYQMERQLLEANVEKNHLHYLLGCIARQEPLTHVLRLICLWSLTNDGIEGDTCDLLMREILSTYGVGAAVWIQNLELAGLLVRAKDPAIFSALGKRFSPPKVPTWAVCRTAFRLLVDYQPKDSTAEADEAEAFSGYIPLSARIVQGALDDMAWKKLLSTLSSVFKNVHTAFEEDVFHESYQVNSVFDAVVVVIGGITRAEAATMKALANASGKRILMVSTAVLNGNGWIEAMLDSSEEWPLVP